MSDRIIDISPENRWWWDLSFGSGGEHSIGFGEGVWPALLGKFSHNSPPPPPGAPWPRWMRAIHPEDWPEAPPIDGVEYLHRGLKRLLRANGGTIEAAKALRAKMQNGELATACEVEGALIPLPKATWFGEHSQRSWWSGKVLRLNSLGGRVESDVFLKPKPEPEAAQEPVKARPEPPPADWWPKRAQTLIGWATDPAVEREAIRRLKAAGVTMTETAKTRVMEAMASEAEVTWSAASIGATRRKAR
jgi:hypothetical protein